MPAVIPPWTHTNHQTSNIPYLSCCCPVINDKAALSLSMLLTMTVQDIGLRAVLSCTRHMWTSQDSVRSRMVSTSSCRSNHAKAITRVVSKTACTCRNMLLPNRMWWMTSERNSKRLQSTRGSSQQRPCRGSELLNPRPCQNRNRSG